MRKQRQARCQECGLTPAYHKINAHAFAKVEDQIVETDQPPHAFRLGTNR